MREFEFVVNGDVWNIHAVDEKTAWAEIAYIFTPGVQYKISVREKTVMNENNFLTLAVDRYEEGAHILALRELGPDVGEPKDAKSVWYINQELERRVMEKINRYPLSRIEGLKVKGLAAAAAIQEIEKWLIEKGGKS